jgi:DNA-binding CsgD family transcriptional regulator
LQHEPIEQALDGCFDAIFLPENWTCAMDALSASLGALGGCFNPYGSTREERARMPASSRYRAMLTEFLDGGWQSQDVRAQNGWSIAARGKPVVYESDMSTEEQRRTLPIYRELFARHDLGMMAAVSLPVNGRAWTLNLVRPETMGGMEARDQDILRVRPALQRLLKLADQASLAAARGVLFALQNAALAAVLIDSRGTVLEVNTVAQGLMGGDLDVRQGRLVARWPANNAALQALIAATTSKADGKLGGSVCIPRENGSPLIVEATRLRSVRAEIFGFAGAILLIADPDARTRPRHQLLQQAFGLTPREADIVRLLAAGSDVAEIADTLGLRRSSVQQIVKSVLQKTNTRRQSNLVAMCARFPGDTKP